MPEKYQTEIKARDITAVLVRELLDYDPETGIFRWKPRRKTHPSWNTKFAGKVAGSTPKGHYTILRLFNRSYYAHRLAWLHVYGEWPEHEIDHVDGCRTNNAIRNLRQATRVQNAWNMPGRKSISGVKGVYRSRDKWEVKVRVGGSIERLGRYSTIEEAAIVARQAREKCHGEYANHVCHKDSS